MFFAAHCRTVLPATLANARFASTAWTASVWVPYDSTFQPILSAISRAQLSYDDPLFTATTLPRRSSSFVIRGAPFFVTNWKSLFR